MKKNAVALVLLLLAAVPAAAIESTPTVLSLKGGGSLVGDLSKLSSFEVELPDGQFARAYVREAVTGSGWDGELVTIWAGHLAGFPESEVSLTQRLGYTAGLVQLGHDQWYLFPDGHLEWIDPAKQLPCGTETGDTPVLPETDDLQAKATATIDLLAVYDSKFQRLAGGAPQAEVLITDAIVRANQGQRDSNAGGQYRLVGVVKLATDILSADPISTLLTSQVQVLRDQYRADLVQGYTEELFLNGRPVAGLSNGYNGTPIGYASVVVYSQLPFVVAAHELGHNGAADHEPTAITRPIQPLPSRAYGFCPEDESDGVGTIMQSGTSPLPGNCVWSQVNLFSSPLLTVKGWPLGIAGQADNASVLRRTAPQLAAFRGTCVPTATRACLLGASVSVEVRGGTARAVEGLDGVAVFQLAGTNLVLVNAVCSFGKLNVTVTANSLSEFSVAVTSQGRSTTIQHGRRKPVPVTNSSLPCG
jgi:hypothetical protein